MRSQTKTRKHLYVSACPQTVFEVQPLSLLEINPLDFYEWEHLKTLLVLAAAIEKEETRHQRTFDACQTIHNCIGTCVSVRSPRSDVPIRALIQVVDILNLPCEF